MKSALKVIASTLLIYSVTGFVALPVVLHFALATYAPSVLTSPVYIGAITFNPFNLTLGMQSVSIGPTRSKPLAGFDRLEVSLGWSSLTDRALNIDRFALIDPVVDIRLLPDGSLNLASLVRSKSQPQLVQPTPATHTTLLPVHLQSVNITGATVDFVDAVNTDRQFPFTTRLDDLNIRAGDIHWPAYQGTVEVSARMDEHTDISALIHLSSSQDGDMPAIEATLDLSQLSLKTLQPYITPATYIDVDTGHLSARSTLTWSADDGALVSAALDITRLQLRDQRTGSQVAGWNQLLIEGLSFKQADNHLKLASVNLQAPSATLKIDHRLQVNLTKLVKPVTSDSKATEVSQSQTPRLSIQRFTLENGQLNFTDNSFQPGFSAPITRLKGEITDFDSNTNGLTTISLGGEIDRYSPVRMTATLNPSSLQSQTGATLSFTDVELTTLTPYASRFAGYTVRKGRMDMDLDYTIANSQLNAHNNILLRHLTLGDKVPGEEVTSLPLKLAIALLKDQDGRIAVDLPVSGDLNNPEFQLGPVIRMALINMITNIVTAPFDLLASLVSGNAEEMSSVTFQPGQSVIELSAQQALATLAKALTERPQLELEIEAFTSTTADGPVIALQTIEQELQSRYLAWLTEQQQPRPEQQPSRIPDEVQTMLLQTLEQEHNLSLSITGQVPNHERRALMAASWPVSKQDLRALAVRRARAIKDTLVDRGLEANRIFILEAQILADSPQLQAVTTQLKLTAE